MTIDAVPAQEGEPLIWFYDRCAMKGRGEKWQRTVHLVGPTMSGPRWLRLVDFVWAMQFHGA